MAAWRSPHDKEPQQNGKRNALAGAIALSLTALALQLVGAWYTGSLALLGDSAHLFTDLLSLVMSLSAVILAARPAHAGRSFGLYRLEVLASFVNGLLLLAVSLSLIYECVQRLLAPSPVLSLELLGVASIGLIFNLLSAALLISASRNDKGGAPIHSCAHGHDHGHNHQHHEDRNLEAALLHVWSDAIGSVAVIAGALVMQFSNAWWVDPAVGLVLAAWILRWAFRVILDSGHVLLEGTPRHVSVDSLEKKMRELDIRVAGVDDLHVWELTSRMYAATAEVRVCPMSLEQAEGIRVRLQAMMHEQFGIAHVVLAIRPS